MINRQVISASVAVKSLGFKTLYKL